MGKGFPPKHQKPCNKNDNLIHNIFRVLYSTDKNTRLSWRKFLHHIKINIQIILRASINQQEKINNPRGKR